jgi:hypothetical protein
MGGGGNFDQINILVARHTQGFLQRDYAQRLIVGAVEANLGRGNFTIKTVRALFPLAAVTKVGSDGWYS